MKLKEIYELADLLAPFALSREYCEKYDAYDNSGILIDFGDEITSVLFSLDCSFAAVEEAKKAGAQLLFTHHPAIYLPIKSLGRENPVTACAKAGISLVSAHLNLDCAVGGIDDSLQEALGGECTEKWQTLSSGGYGCISDLKESLSLKEFVKRAKEKLCARRVLVYGDRPVGRVASFCGAGMEEESIRFALKKGADTLVSSDAKHHLLVSAIESGLNVVVFTHYAAENYGFRKFYRKIKEKCPLVRTEYFTDERLM